MINCDFLIFNNFNDCIKESIPFLYSWFSFLNSIHALRKKWTIISIERNIGVISFKQVQIIGWWTDTDYFINGKSFILNELLISKILSVSICIAVI